MLHLRYLVTSNITIFVIITIIIIFMVIAQVRTLSQWRSSASSNFWTRTGPSCLQNCFQVRVILAPVDRAHVVLLASSGTIDYREFLLGLAILNGAGGTSLPTLYLPTPLRLIMRPDRSCSARLCLRSAKHSSVFVCVKARRTGWRRPLPLGSRRSARHSRLRLRAGRPSMGDAVC